MGAQIGLLLLPLECEMNTWGEHVQEDLDEFFDAMRNIRINYNIFYEDTTWFSAGYGHFDFVSPDSIYLLYEDYDEEDEALGEPRNTIYVTDDVAKKLHYQENVRLENLCQKGGEGYVAIWQTAIVKFNRNTGEFRRHLLKDIPHNEMVGNILISVRCQN